MTKYFTETVRKKVPPFREALLFLFVVPGLPKSGEKVAPAVLDVFRLGGDVSGADQRPLGEKRSHKFIDQNGKEDDV